MSTSDFEASSGTRQPAQCVKRADPAAGVSGYGRTHNPELWERPNTKNEAGPKYNVDRVCQPQHAHRDCRITGAAKNSVNHEEHHHGRVASQHDSGEAGAVLNHPL